MALGKINHIHIYVDNLEKVHEHFVEKLGFKPVGNPVHGAKSVELVIPAGEEVRLEFFQLTEEYKKSDVAAWGRPHIDHIGFEVNNVDKEYEEIRNKGVPFKTAPFREPTGRKLCRTCDADRRFWIQVCEVKTK